VPFIFIFIGIVPPILLFDDNFTKNLPAYACNFHMDRVYLVMNRQDTAPKNLIKERLNDGVKCWSWFLCGF
jgi:hypothetical protein